MSRNILRNLAIAAATIVIVDAAPGLPFGGFVKNAEALPGQPWTAASGAGVARRTTRRTVRRSTHFFATLPPACVRTSVDGVVVWRCGATYYQRHSGGYVVVYID